jgi:hypothetical protein
MAVIARGAGSSNGDRLAGLTAAVWGGGSVGVMFSGRTRRSMRIPLRLHSMMHPASRGGKGNLFIFRSRCANFFLPVVIEITLSCFGADRIIAILAKSRVPMSLVCVTENIRKRSKKLPNEQHSLFFTQ